MRTPHCPRGWVGTLEEAVVTRTQRDTEQPAACTVAARQPGTLRRAATPATLTLSPDTKTHTLRSLPHLAAKILQRGHAPHLQVKQRALDQLQLAQPRVCLERCQRPLLVRDARCQELLSCLLTDDLCLVRIGC